MTHLELLLYLLTVVQPPAVAPPLIGVQVHAPCLGGCRADEADARGEFAQLVVGPAAVGHHVHAAERQVDVRGVGGEQLLTGLAGEGAAGG